jgi:tetratricopeptide (TPR) repeat protein
LIRQPGAALRLYALKLRLLLGAGERSNNNNPYFWSKWSPVLRWPVWLGWAPILLLAVLGLFRRDLAAPRRLLLLGTAGAYALSLLAFFINGRFRLPLLALLAIPAGGGLERLWSAVRTRRWPDARAGVAVALALFLFSLSDLLTFRENRTDADPFSRFTLGNAYADEGNLSAARAAYEDALAVQRRFQVASFALIEEPLYTSLGRILLGQNQPDAAVRLYTDWVRGDPTSVAGRVALGDLLLQLGRADDAAAQFETARRMAPDDPRAALGYAWILRANGDAGSALRRFRAVVGHGQDVQALFGEGLCLIDLERYGDAAQTFEDLLRIQPDYWQAVGNLAGVYDRLGREAEARQAYRRLLSLHPGDQQAQRWLAEHPG